MIAAIYDATGTIVQSVQGTEEMAKATATVMGLDYIEITEDALGDMSVDAFDATHHVANGALVPN